jgi:hypothetical protein
MGPPELAKKLVEALRSRGFDLPQRLSVEGQAGEIIHILVVTEMHGRISGIPEPVAEPPSRVRQRDGMAALPEEELA